MPQKSMAPKIAIYLPTLNGGGAERVMVTLATAFAERGDEVDLVLAKPHGPYLKDVNRHVRVVSLGGKRVLASLPALAGYLRRERPKVMLTALNHANVVAVVAHALARVPTKLVVSVHNTLTFSNRFDRSARARALLPLMRWAYPRASGVVAVSTGVADDLVNAIGLARERISVVHNPVVTAEMSEQVGAPLDHHWFAEGAPPVILGIGRLTPQKDFPTLLRAFAKVRSVRNCRLVILGEGKQRADLEALVRDLRLHADVAMPGFVPNPFPWMRRASLFVLSSAWEGFGNALVEAMACGTPVVSTDCPSGPAEILAGGVWGRLVPVGNNDALADAVLATMAAPSHPDVAMRASDFSLAQAVAGYYRVFGLARS
jgi:glycosyltransferase involved in cell wall biosynthesis